MVISGMDYDARMVPGVTVRLSGTFLKNTGQRLGSAGLDRWVVQACPCESCTTGCTVATNEEKSDASLSLYTPAELQAEPYLRMKHILRCNLSINGVLTARDCP